MITKIYLSIIGLILFLLFSLGFALPYLFSAKSDELVVFGVVYVILGIPVLYNLVKHLLQLIKKQILINHLNEKDEKN